MKQLSGPISDRLREKLDPADPAWTPTREGHPASEKTLKDNEDHQSLRGRP